MTTPTVEDIAAYNERRAKLHAAGIEVTDRYGQDIGEPASESRVGDPFDTLGAARRLEKPDPYGVETDSLVDALRGDLQR